MTSLLTTAAGKAWERIGAQQHHGINTPLFSLRTKNSCGIGEYLDLIPLIDWIRSIGFDVIQLLPLNDTGDTSSPYSALSAFALNPIHLSLKQLPYLNEDTALTAKLQEFNPLNQLQRIDYKKVLELKNQFLHTYVKRFRHKIESQNNFQAFLLHHSDWLYEYALFKTLKEKKNWQPFHLWTEKPDNFHVLLQQYKDDIQYHIILQYLCFQQMQQVRHHAEEKGIFIKGDIPILINRESSDVWFHPSLFKLDCSAGSPPDMYSREGQNWGFPVYNWTTIRNENYRWWKRRLDVASCLYHIYRLDHVVGLFRIWSIPLGRPGNEGAFDPSNPAEWIQHGETILLQLLENSCMLPIAEDLGTVPPESRVKLKELGICGTKVMRWERLWNDPGKPFIYYTDYIPESMTTVSTHDSETLKQWWKYNPDDAKEFSKFKTWDYKTDLSLDRQREILHDSHHTKSLFHINLLQEYLALFPELVWPTLEDERINTPGLISDLNWTYRYKPYLEDIVSNQPLAITMQTMLQ